MMLHRHFDAKEKPQEVPAQNPEAVKEPERILEPAKDIREGEDIIQEEPRKTSRRKSK